jgi:hypothetical protein
VLEVGGDVIEVVEVGLQGPPGPPGVVDAAAVDAAVRQWLDDNGIPGIPAIQFTRMAAMNLSALRAVWEENDGFVHLLHYNDPESRHAISFVGVTVTAADSGTEVVVQRAGELDVDGLGLSLGPVWLGESGMLTNTPPSHGFRLYLGTVVSGSYMILWPSEPVFLE